MKLTDKFELIDSGLGKVLFNPNTQILANKTEDEVLSEIAKFFTISDINTLTKFGFSYTKSQLEQLQTLFKKDLNNLKLLLEKIPYSSPDNIIKAYKKLLDFYEFEKISKTNEWKHKQVIGDDFTELDEEEKNEQWSNEPFTLQSVPEDFDKVIQICGDYSKQIGGSEASQSGGHYCTQIAYGDSYQTASSHAIQKSYGTAIEQISSHNSIQYSEGDSSHMETGDYSEQTFKGDKCFIYFGNYCTLNAEGTESKIGGQDHNIIDGTDYNELNLGNYNTIKAGNGNTINCGDYNTIDFNDVSYNSKNNTVNCGDNNTIKGGDSNTIIVKGESLNLIYGGMFNTIIFESYLGTFKYESGVDFNEFSDVKFEDCKPVIW